MFKKIATTLLSAALACTFVACGNNVATTTTEKDVAEADTTEDREANTLAEGNESDSNAASEEVQLFGAALIFMEPDTVRGVFCRVTGSGPCGLSQIINCRY